ncbi:MAG: CBS domain-containing protein [Deltaproteobacteria bacterium]|jgi:CBS domain-containing protein|nr:CBS domain-containing protein [Deltaproteobacteria bacterium]
MNVKVEELMAKNVVTVQPHHTADHVRGIFERNGFGVAPVVGPGDALLGVVSASDLISNDIKPGSKVSHFMTEKVYVVNRYDGPHIAARIMRNHEIHHVVVTEDDKVVGMISSFDLLKLVEGHRYVEKSPPTPAKKKQPRV